MYMTPKGTPDPEYPSSSSRKGDRKDKKNLIDIWLNARKVSPRNPFIAALIVFVNGHYSFT